MRFETFIENVQKRAGISSRSEAESIVKATLETLGERLYRTERLKLAAQLSDELKEHLLRRLGDDRFLLEEFYNRISARADVGFQEAVRQARIVMDVLKEAVSSGEIEDIRDKLPDEFAEIFGEEPVGASSPSG